MTSSSSSKVYSSSHYCQNVPRSGENIDAQHGMDLVQLEMQTAGHVQLSHHKRLLAHVNELEHVCPLYTSRDTRSTGVKPAHATAERSHHTSKRY